MRRLLQLLIACCAVTAVCATAQATVVFPRTLTRTADAVILEARDCGELLGAPLQNYRMLALQDNQLQPIPFQLDERDSDGELVFPFGRKANQDQDEGKFDANDLIVFMATDAGGRAPVQLWPAGRNGAVEIELVDPLDQGRAWVYLFRFDSAAPALSPTDYVNYDHQQQMVRARYFIMGFAPEAPIGIGYLGYTPEGGGDGSNLADRLKVRFEADTLFSIHISKNEEDFTSKTIAWIDGPVRVVRRTKNRMILFWRIPSPSAVLDNIYYANAFEFPTRIDLPFNVDSMLSNPRFYVSTDTRAVDFERKFYNERNTRGVLIDGKMSPKEQTLDRRTYKWMAMAGTTPECDGAFINRLVFDEQATKVVPRLFYRDNVNVPSPPEKYPGSVGEAGYVLSNLESVEAGALELVSIMYHTRRYKPGDEIEFMNILDHPLQVKARYSAD
ncbi:MAG: hypothetical protein P9M14_14390 [Candidatus Alcyoniella australis]|nr:hypothetical protein [Candidatus Alcyoniella australis]